MSSFAYTLSGGKTRVQRFRAGIAMATVGVPVIGTTDNNSGVLLGTATAGVDQLGMNIDAASPTYAEGAHDGSGVDPAAYVHVVTNPDAVWQTRMSGAATSGSAVIPYFNTVASTTGLIVTPSATSGGSTVDMSAMDDCTMFCYSGNNAGLYRDIQPADATNCDTVVAFPYDIAVDDQFIFAGMGLHASAANAQTMTFTTTLDEYNALVATAVNTASYYRIVGDALGGIRQYPASERAYLKAIELDPTDANARTELGMMYMQWGLEAKARNTLDAAWTLDPFNERTQFTLELFETLTKSSHYVIAYGLTSAKKTETRQRRFAKFIDMLVSEEKPT